MFMKSRDCRGCAIPWRDFRPSGGAGHDETARGRPTGCAGRGDGERPLPALLGIDLAAGPILSTAMDSSVVWISFSAVPFAGDLTSSDRVSGNAVGTRAMGRVMGLDS